MHDFRTSLAGVTWYQSVLDIAPAPSEWVLDKNMIDNDDWKIGHVRELDDGQPEKMLYQVWISGEDFCMWYNNNPMWRVNPRSGILYQEMAAKAERANEPIPDPILQFPDASWYVATGRHHWRERYTCRLTESDLIGYWFNDTESHEDTGDSVTSRTELPRNISNPLKQWFRTPLGKRYHVDRECFGLRNASAVKTVNSKPSDLEPCKICCP